jgi:hypothetical protein
MVATLLLSSAGALSLWMLRGRIKPRAMPVALPPVAARRAQAPRLPVDAPRPIVPAPKPIAPAPMPTAEPELEMLEWDGVQVEKPAAPPAAPPPATRAAVENFAALRGDPLRLRLRDRYIKARFPGVAESSADLEDGPRVVKAVRLYFGEQKFDRADELLEIAIEQTSGAMTLRLAQLELAFLRRQAAAFTVFARAFRNTHPMDPAWNEICRLGRVLAPLETTLFGETRGERLHDRYGPWPIPNWLQASWDFTPEVLAADLHREMASTATVASSALQLSAA